MYRRVPLETAPMNCFDRYDSHPHRLPDFLRCGRVILWGVLVVLPMMSATAHAGKLPEVVSVERQPLVAATKRLVEALNYAGTPLPPADVSRLKAAYAEKKDAAAVKMIQAVLDRYSLVGVHINAESRVKVAEGAAPRQLVQQGWRTFLVKVHNEAGVTAKLVANSPQALPVYMRGQGARQRPQSCLLYTSDAADE